MMNENARTGACTPPTLRIGAPVLSKLAVAACLEVSGIEDAQDFFLGTAPRPASMALYLRFSTIPGADLSALRSLLQEHVRERLRWFAGVEIDTIEVELEPGSPPIDQSCPPCA